MAAERVFELTWWGMLLACPVVFGVLLRLPAAYGRHKNVQGAQPARWWGPGIPTRWAWILMESPSSIGFAVIFALGDRALEPVPLLLLLMWQSHYVQRSFVYPLRMRVRPGDTTPLLIPLLAIVTNLAVSFLNASTLSWSRLGPVYDSAWLGDPRFVGGVLVFALGYHINRKADAMLAALRRPGESGYRIPRGWLFERVSCPNYLGEFLIWSGWAIATWSPAGALFLLWTLSNLVPRALANHRWYRTMFAEYPPRRRAVIPYLL
ncbi:MAG: hypothetical protein PHP86_17480 [Nevskiales bacterium]|nr:hypothetical protein [Nevskiales bacterium]